ncbi:MAG: hypothetical protein KatS3mg012_2402 [Gaiellaceae bacterium]|nr:MAG: hypothetical protein KatS3mg012_2402 [Gaiellaceae bacterium]
MREEHVEVARRPERRPEPAELLAERPCPLALKERPRGPQKSAGTPRGDTHLVEILGIAAEPRARVVDEQPLGLLDERDAQNLERGCVDRHRDARPRGLDAERAVQLRYEWRLLGAGSHELHDEPLQHGIVVGGELHLELPEALDDACAIENGHRVLDDLGALDPHAPTTRAKASNPDERGSADDRREEVEHRLWRTSGRARLLELDARRPPRELQLPHARPGFQPMSERNPMPRQPQIGGVDVGGDELAGRKLWAEGSEPEAATRDELRLALDGRSHPLQGSAARADSSRTGERPARSARCHGEDGRTGPASRSPIRSSAPGASE